MAKFRFFGEGFPTVSATFCKNSAKSTEKYIVLVLPELGEFFHDAIDGVCLGVVAVDDQGYFLFRVHSREYMIF